MRTQCARPRAPPIGTEHFFSLADRYRYRAGPVLAINAKVCQFSRVPPRRATKLGAFDRQSRPTMDDAYGPTRMESDSGMTLVELLTVVAITAIMAAFAMPRLAPLVLANRLDALMAEAGDDIEFALSEAMRRGQPVTLCPTRGARGDCARLRDWQAGWIVFVDVNGNGVRDAGETVVRQRSAFGTGVAVTPQPRMAALMIDGEGVFVGLPRHARMVFTLTASGSQTRRCIGLRNLTAEYVLQRPGQGSCS